VRPPRSPRVAEGLILPAGEKHAVSEHARSEAPVKLLAQDVPPGRSVDVKFRQSKVEGTEPVAEVAKPQARAAGSVEGDGPAYRQVGEEVTAVLTAAEHAAAQIRKAALREAEKTRRDADERAASVLAEAEARRAEADSYSQETRAAADAHAEETRRNTEELAARSVSQAEERARQIRAQAEQAASDLQAAAIRRRDDLAKGAEGMEARIESMRAVFRGVVTELEELLPADRRRAEEPEPPADERLDEALKPASPHASG
jgi:flagellar biosynthesis GTPase FlhF